MHPTICGEKCKQICLCLLMTSFVAANGIAVIPILHCSCIITTLATFLVRDVIRVTFSYESENSGHLKLPWLQLFVKNISLSQSANISLHVSEGQKHL